MKQFFFITALTVVFLQACNNTSLKSSCNDYDTIGNVVINKSKIPDGYASGKGTEFIPNTKAEHNLVSQSNTYNQALLNGNVDEMKRYFYKECLDYYKKYRPDLSTEEILDEFLSMISEDYIKTLHEYEKHGIEISMYINDIVRKVEYGDDYLYVYGICGRMGGYKNDSLVYLHSTMPDLTIGVSHNKGKNWTFMAMTDEVPSILVINYPQSVVDEVMGY